MFASSLSLVGSRDFRHGRGSHDESIEDRVRRVLQSTRQAPLQRVNVHVHEKLIILRGSVPTWYLKQLASTVVMAAVESCQVENEIEVQSAS